MLFIPPEESKKRVQALIFSSEADEKSPGGPTHHFGKQILEIPSC